MLDWFRIRKYAQTEPAVQIGTEQDAGNWSVWTQIQPGQSLPAGRRYWRIKSIFSSDGIATPVLNDYTLSFGTGTELFVENVAPQFIEIKAVPSSVTDTQNIQIIVQASEPLAQMPDVKIIQNGATGTMVVMESQDNITTIVPVAPF